MTDPKDTPISNRAWLDKLFSNRGGEYLSYQAAADIKAKIIEHYEQVAAQPDPSNTEQLEQAVLKLISEYGGAWERPAHINPLTNGEVTREIMALVATHTAEAVRAARIDENWLLIKQSHKVADENGGSLRKTKCSLEAIVYYAKNRLAQLKKGDV